MHEALPVQSVETAQCTVWMAVMPELWTSVTHTCTSEMWGICQRPRCSLESWRVQLRAAGRQKPVVPTVASMAVGGMLLLFPPGFAMWTQFSPGQMQMKPARLQRWWGLQVLCSKDSCSGCLCLAAVLT